MTRLWKNTLASSFAFLTVGVLALGCGGNENGKTGDGDQTKNGGGKSAGLDAFPAGTATGFISGKVSYTGDDTKPSYHDVASQPECGEHHNNGLLVQAKFKLGKDGGLPNVFIEVKGLEWSFDPPKTPVKIDQVNCEYIPNVVGIMVGQDLEVTSSDGFSHNVKWVGKKNRPTKLNFTVNKGEKHKLKGQDWRKTELAKFECSIHSWMSCEFHVVKHTVFTVSDADGNFRLPVKLPDGEYEIEFRHAKRGNKTIKVTIAGKDPESVTVEFN